MPLVEPNRVDAFHRGMAESGFAAIRDVRLPERYFATGPRGAVLVGFKRLDDDSGYILLLDDTVRYVGRDPDVVSLFANEPDRGWRPLSIIPAGAPEAVLRRADAILGLDGRPPRAPTKPPEGKRDVVVHREDLAPGESADGDVEKERFGEDLVDEARRGKLRAPLFRERESEALVRILAKAGKNAATLVGPPGTGKTAIVEGLAIRVAKGQVPSSLRHARILDVNLAFLAAGSAHAMEFHGRVKRLLDSARTDPGTILFLDELHVLRQPGSDAANMIKSDLGRGRVRCIGATTNAEFRLIEADAALARRFQVIPVRELTPAQTVEVLRGCREWLESHHAVSIPEELLAKVVQLAIRRVPDRRLPDKAIDLLDEACALVAGRGALKGADAQEARP